MPNPLEEFPVLRRWLYRILWVVGALVGLWQAVALAADLSTPTTTKIVGGVLAAVAYLSVLSNYTADRNVGQAPDVQRVVGNAVVADAPVAKPVNETGAWYESGILIAIACIVVILCGLVWLLQNLG